MRRKITVFLIIAVCYLLQSTVFQALSFASISPNLMIVVVSAFGFMRGKKEGLWIGFFTGLLLDVFTGSILGFYALLYMYVGYFNGFFLFKMTSTSSICSKSTAGVMVPDFVRLLESVSIELIYPIKIPC